MQHSFLAGVMRIGLYKQKHGHLNVCRDLSKV